ncbi:unnamed protein product [Mytilus edulis]|uniref:Reverse transcriptase domain-containing protein n=1 Tax=Mytilus edulis TaxID=6550 RepID=A0A8S3TV16_MYTED|nr:unnamed protein product [Mytilus edulis]
MQAEEKFTWGTYRQDLRDFQLVSKRENPTTRAMNDATKPHGKQSANNDRRRGPFLPDGREICRNFNNNSCYRQDCRMMHHCAICMSSSHSAISGHGHSNHSDKAWNRLLPASADDRDFILNGVKDGFKLSVVYGPHLLVDRTNYSSAFRFHRAVEKQIKLEIELGNYVVTKTKPIIISSIGAIEKSNGDVRIIHDASLPTGISLNSYTTDTSCSYMDLRHALKIIKRNDYLGKIDLKSAYRSVKCHDSDYPLTGLQWTFNGDDSPTYMYDAKLPFGHARSPKIFQQLSASVCEIMKCTYNITCIAYLDDILVIADTEDTVEGCSRYSLLCCRIYLYFIIPFCVLVN